mmetsp:Transcript_65597/g.133421  ORF Transcript_65597/g.133421 Transcript_65597/m.133421 type:complete len:337 (+) Transcript_65597:814-1824(+)
MLLPRLVRRRERELLDLLELVNSEDPTDISTTAAGFAPEAGGVTDVADGELRLVNALSLVEGRDRLFGSRDEVLIELRIVLVLDHLVKDIVVVRQLRSLGHQILLHEERRLQRCVAALTQEGETVVDQGLVQEHAGTLEEVGSVPGDVLAGGELHSADHFQELEVGPEARGLDLQAPEVARHSPRRDHLVVLILILRDGHRVVDDVPHAPQLLVALLEDFVGESLQFYTLLFQLLLLRKQVLTSVRALGGLLALGDLVLQSVDLFPLLIGVELCLDPVVVKGDDLVDELGAAEAPALRLFHDLGVAALVLSKEVDADSHLSTTPACAKHGPAPTAN